MTTQEAITILNKLLDGYHPLKNEELEEGNVCLEPEVNHAIYMAQEALQKSLSQPKRKRPQLHPNRPWTERDRQFLISMVLEEHSLEEICVAMHRSRRGVQAQLRELDLELQTTMHSTGNWSEDEQEWLLAAWNEGCSPQQMADSVRKK